MIHTLTRAISLPLIEGETLSELKLRFCDIGGGLALDSISFVVDGFTLLADDPVTGTLDVALAPMCGKPRRLLFFFTIA